MTHRINTAAPSEVLAYFQRLWRLLLNPHFDMGSKLERLFANETDEFGLNHAFLARIDPDAGTEYFEIVHSPNSAVTADDVAPLGETYCRKTIEDLDETMVVNDALAEGWGDDPAYERFGFGSYVGTTVKTEEELYGTLCFANVTPRDEPITDKEIELVEMVGQWVTYELNQWTGPPTHETISQNLDDYPSLLTPQIDSMMDALGEQPRRFILLGLLDEQSDIEELLLERMEGDVAARLSVYHVHLPKLETAGYIEWDNDTNTVSRGPSFSEIEPLLRLLKDYTTEFPE